MNFVSSVLGETKWVCKMFWCHRWFSQSSGRTRTWSKPKTTTPLLSDNSTMLSFSISYVLFNSCILFSLRKATWKMRKKHSETIYASYKWFVSTLNWRDWSPFAILLKRQNISYSPALFRWLAQMSRGQQAAGKEPTKASGVSRSLAGGASPPPFSSIFLLLFDPVCLFCSILFHYLNTCAYFPCFAIIWSPVPFLFHLFPLFRFFGSLWSPLSPFFCISWVFLARCHFWPYPLVQKRYVTDTGPQLTF